MPTEEEIARARFKRLKIARARFKRLMKSDEEIDRALIFVAHIEKHLKDDISFSRHAKVICKICNKTIDEIYEEARA